MSEEKFIKEMEELLDKAELMVMETHMIKVAQDLITPHAGEIISALDEMYKTSREDGRATLKVPLTLCVQKDIDAGYIFSGNINIKITETIKDEREPIAYNPAQPELPGISERNEETPETQKENPAPETESLCNHPHADGKRKCTKAKGHEGYHKYGVVSTEEKEPEMYEGLDDETEPDFTGEDADDTDLTLEE
jgi:hypothetical protein